MYFGHLFIEKIQDSAVMLIMRRFLKEEMRKSWQGYMQFPVAYLQKVES